MGLGTAGQRLRAFGNYAGALVELGGTLGHLANDAGEVFKHSLDTGSQFVDRFVAFDGDRLGQITLGGGANDLQQVVHFGAEGFGRPTFLFGGLLLALLGLLLVGEEGSHPVAELPQGVLAGDLDLLGVVALGNEVGHLEDVLDLSLGLFGLLSLGLRSATLFFSFPGLGFLFPLGGLFDVLHGLAGCIDRRIQRGRHLTDFVLGVVIDLPAIVAAGQGLQHTGHFDHRVGDHAGDEEGHQRDCRHGHSHDQPDDPQEIGLGLLGVRLHGPHRRERFRLVDLGQQSPGGAEDVDRRVGAQDGIAVVVGDDLGVRVAGERFGGRFRIDAVALDRTGKRGRHRVPLWIQERIGPHQLFRPHEVRFAGFAHSGADSHDAINGIQR